MQDISVKEDALLVGKVGHVAHDLTNFRPRKCGLELIVAIPDNSRSKGVLWSRAIGADSKFGCGPAFSTVFTPQILDQGHMLVDVVIEVVFGIELIGEQNSDGDSHLVCGMKEIANRQVVVSLKLGSDDDLGPMSLMRTDGYLKTSQPVWHHTLLGASGRFGDNNMLLGIFGDNRLP